MRKALADLMKKPAADLTPNDLEAIAEYKREQAEKAVRAQRKKLEAKIDRLNAQLEEAQSELDTLPGSDKPTSKTATGKPRKMNTTKPGSTTHLLTEALYEANAPMTIDKLFEKIGGKMKSKSKNPKQNLTATLNQGRRFQRVARGQYTLSDEARRQWADQQGKK